MLSYIPQCSSSIWHWLTWIMAFLTGPVFGVLVAFAVIISLHRNSNIMTFVHYMMDNGIQDALLDCVLGLFDLVRAYYQIFCEIIRNMMSSTGSTEHASAIGLLNKSTTSRTSRGSAPPPLVIQPFENDAKLQWTGVRGFNSQGEPSIHRPPSPSGSLSSSTTQNAAMFQEIEPAFLDDNDYPQGWLVYHSTLGVISKEEADIFNRQAMAAKPG